MNSSFYDAVLRTITPKNTAISNIAQRRMYKRNMVKKKTDYINYCDVFYLKMICKAKSVKRCICRP